MATTTAAPSVPSPQALIALLKPITWFPPMWAFACGAVSAPWGLAERWDMMVLGVILAGPLVCGTSQVVNDWFDRHVDAINEPNRPIPSGRVPGKWGLYFALLWTLVSLGVAWFLGPWVFFAACFGMALAWAYSAPPFRLKRNGWWGNSAVGLCYEGLPWFTGAAVVSATAPSADILIIALLYSFGAIGIMVLNDFKSIEGDTKLGLKSIPVMLGAPAAARFACWTMAIPQMAVIGLLAMWGGIWISALIALGLLLQLVFMRRLLTDPRSLAPWYNATGVTTYVLGMMAAAVALNGLS